MTDQTVYTDQDLFALLDLAEKDAQAAQARSQFGKCTINTVFQQWYKDEEGKPKVDPVSKKPLAPVQVDGTLYATLPAKERGIKFEVNINIKEFNSDLGFSYDRSVNFGNGEWWSATWPSITQATGEKKLRDAMAKLNGQYIEALDLPSSDKVSAKGNPLRIFTVGRIFASREECFAAHQAKYGKKGELPEVTPTIEIPEGGTWTAESWPGVFPEFKKACDEASTKPEPVRKQLVAKIANDYVVADTFVMKFIVQ
jgi:hypothetical protein